MVTSATTASSATPLPDQHHGLYYSATVDSQAGRIYLKIVNPGAQSVPSQLTFTGRRAMAAGIEVLGNPRCGGPPG